MKSGFEIITLTKQLKLDRLLLTANEHRKTENFLKTKHGREICLFASLYAENNAAQEHFSHVTKHSYVERT